MAMAPVPTPAVLWHRPPVLAIAAVPGTALGVLGEPSTASSAAWAATGAVIRRLHDAPLPPWRGVDPDDVRARLDRECAWLHASAVLPADVVRLNREIAEADLLAGYGPGADRDVIRAWWSLRSLVASRWLIEHGFDPDAPGCELDVLRSRAREQRV